MLAGGPAVVLVGFAAVVPVGVGGRTVVLVAGLLGGTVDERTVGAVCSCGVGVPAVVVVACVGGAPTSPGVPVVVATPGAVTVEVVWPGSEVTLGRLVVAVDGFVVVVA